MSRRAHMAFLAAFAALALLGLWLWRGHGALIWLSGVISYCF